MADLTSASGALPINWRERLEGLLAHPGISHATALQEPATGALGKRIDIDVLIAVVSVFLATIFYLPVIVVIGLCVLMRFLVPRMPPHTRRLVAIEVAIMSVINGAWPLLTDEKGFVPIGLSIAVLVFFEFIGPGPIGLMYRKSRTEEDGITTNPAEAIARARQPPILLLRSFAFDSALSQRSINPLSWEQELVTFLSTAMDTCVIALGKPGEFEPPLGAARFYVRHDLWQLVVEQTSVLCSLVVWTSGRTAALRWEIEHLQRSVPPHRLLLWVHANIGKRSAEDRDIEWAKFLDEVGDAFRKPLPRDIRNTQWIAFDDDWVPHAIPGAEYPALPGEPPKFYGLSSFLKKLSHAA